MNTKEVAADLRYCRKESGLSGVDVSHLLSITASRLSRIENGRSELKPRELCGLALIYNKQHFEMFPILFEAIAEDIKSQLEAMPPEPAAWRAHDARLESLQHLYQQLEKLNSHPHEDITL